MQVAVSAMAAQLAFAAPVEQAYANPSLFTPLLSCVILDFLWAGCLLIELEHVKREHRHPQ